MWPGNSLDKEAEDKLQELSLFVGQSFYNN